MSVKIITSDTKIAWLSKKTNVGGKLVSGQAVLYVSDSPFRKLGQVTRESMVGLTPHEAVEARYAGMKSVLGEDLVIHAIIVIDAFNGPNFGYDDNSRCFISALYDKGEVTFNANYGEFQKESTNSEALINYKDSDYDYLIKALQQWLGLIRWFNTKDPINWRWHQEEDVKEILTKLIELKEALYAAYTGRGKTLIALEVVVRLLNKLNRGGIVLVTTPVSDTKNSFKKILDNTFLGFDRETKISYYDSVTFGKQDIEDLQNRTNNGEIIFVILTVQDLRYKDKDVDKESAILRQKYESLGDKVTVWIRDERHKEYEGEQTLKQLECVKPEYYLDLTATPYNVQEKYSEKTIISRSLLWGLLNRKNTGLPSISIEVLQNLMFDKFPNIGGLFSEEEGYDPRKLFVRQNGNFCLAKELIDLFTLMYVSPFSRDKNKFSISNDCGLLEIASISNNCGLSEIAKRCGLVVLPEGQDGDSASNYIPALAILLNQLVKGNILFIDAYTLERDFEVARRRVGPKYTIGDYVEDLLKDHEKVIILTCGKLILGSDIPSLGHIVLFDKISSLATFEQLLGRMARVFPDKAAVKMYCFAPGHTIKLIMGQMAIINKNLGEGAEFELLDCVPLTEYEGTDFKKVTPEEIIGELQKHFNELIRRKLPSRTLSARLSETFNSADWGGVDLGKFKSTAIETDVSDANGAKVKEKQSKSTGDKSKKKTNLLEKVELLFQEVYNELRWIAYTNSDLDLDALLSRDELIQMFGSDLIDRIRKEVNKNWKLRRFIWEELNKVKLAFKDASDEELSKCIFYNTAFKQKAGLVYTPWALAEEIVGKIKAQYQGKEPPKRLLAVNSLNGAFPLILRREFPDAEIVCLEYFPYFKKYLEDKGFEVIMWSKDLETGGRKFDVVVGNPPYNKNLIKKDYSVYSHIAMNSEKEGYIGFTISSLENLLEKDGILLFITPGKFMIGSGTTSFRKWLIDNYNLTDIVVKPNDIFKGVGIDKVVIFRVENNNYKKNTVVYNINGNKTKMDVKNNPDYIIPDFENQTVYDKFLELDNISKINPRTSKSIGGYGEDFKKNFSPVQTEEFHVKVARTITGPNIVEYEYSNLPSTLESKNWRVIINMSFGREFAVIPPGVEHDHTKLGFSFPTEEEARGFYQWTQSDLFKKFWIGLSMTRHTHVFIRYIPVNEK
ncbi:MAG: DEAD/DEAH box helicase family protein [Richelia sp. RM2_1_2]|nr:DEAD/DEAH box helicase family protein [Richelia sp. RM2_1_2]